MKYALLATTSYTNALSELGQVYPDLLFLWEDLSVSLHPCLNPTHPGITDFNTPQPTMICDSDELMATLEAGTWTSINILAVGSTQEEMWANLDANTTNKGIYKAFPIAQFEAEDPRLAQTITLPDGEGGTFEVPNPQYMEYRKIAVIS